MKEEKLSLLQRCIKWRENNIKEKQFILILSFLVGIFTAFAALLLKFFIHQIQNFLTDNFNATEANYLYLVYPVVGIFLAGWFVRNIVKDDISHGVTKILYAISRRQGRIKRHNIWSSTIASAITIGFGGSVGAEAPIVLTGSAIGSNLGSVFKMEHRTLMLLVGCGAAGAIAGIFKAPIAGLVFTLEVLMIDLTMSSLLPLLISAVTAATVSYITTGTEAMFKFHLDQAFELERIPFVILLGIFCGLISLYFTRAMNSVEGVFGKLNNPYKKLAFGGVMLSVLIFLFPPLYGEGYDTINLLLNGTSAAEWDTVMNYDAFMEPVSWFLTGMEKHSDEFNQGLLGNSESFIGAMTYHMPAFYAPSLYTAMNELDNHDHSRFLTRTNHRVGRVANVGPYAAAENTNKAVLREAVVIQMTWPGAPTLYYGDEAGQVGFTDPDNRRTYPWGQEDQELIRFYKEMIAVHRRFPVLAMGSLKFLCHDYNVLSYGRFNQEEQVIVIINNRNERVHVEIPVWLTGINRSSVAKLTQVFATDAVGFSSEEKEIEAPAGILEMDLLPLSGVVLHRCEE
jgi:H+/Cl- antiporter ClcA